MAAQGRAAVGHQADARPHHTSRSAHLRQCGADDNHIDQDELFDCHVNSITAWTSDHGCCCAQVQWARAYNPGGWLGIIARNQ
ncbi:hypothetical protein MRB56_16620 [Halomonas cupida]|uniref:hypothetical protein n=1 Tax=Halomonas cupida TaxID=44933 RepID=UPI0011610178|nr:hypothetical protein [Halomonas cupida]